MWFWLVKPGTNGFDQKTINIAIKYSAYIAPLHASPKISYQRMRVECVCPNLTSKQHGCPFN